jgi:hypothetical protein
MNRYVPAILLGLSITAAATTAHAEKRYRSAKIWNTANMPDGRIRIKVTPGLRVGVFVGAKGHLLDEDGKRHKGTEFVVTEVTESEATAYLKGWTFDMLKPYFQRVQIQYDTKAK